MFLQGLPVLITRSRLIRPNVHHRHAPGGRRRAAGGRALARAGAEALGRCASPAARPQKLLDTCERIRADERAPRGSCGMLGWPAFQQGRPALCRSFALGPASHSFGLQHCFELGAHRPGRPPAGGMWTRPTEAPSSLRASAHTGLTTQLCGGESSTAACKHTSGVRRRRRRQGSPWQPGGRLHTSEAHASLPMHVQDESQPRAEQQR